MHLLHKWTKWGSVINQKIIYWTEQKLVESSGYLTKQRTCTVCGKLQTRIEEQTI